MHVAASLTYTLLVLMAGAAGPGPGQGPAGRVRGCCSAAGIVLAPAARLPGTFVLLHNDPDHVGSAVSP